ncbi:ssDNA-binding protein [Pectobacterium phage PP47]|uniref:Single-stranded DNA-binding protein n=1 Tax=Pectobacterium phage PP47 TaxID=1932882 RepID=A0A1P8L674_9CAUD|nr:Gp2.5-like ssDNA binding protein and ssDNA annealing protein [Pectobacterium phage PP47]APW79757.1 ssDNA-binding protein [Pectobacterium phage PP47]
MAFNLKKVYTSGLGTADGYVYLNKPDYGNEEKGFGNPRGVYKVDLTLDNASPACKRMVKEIVDMHNEHYAEKLADYEANPPTVARGKKPLLPYEGDMPFIDNGDGTTTFKVKCYASFQDKKTKETKHIVPTIVDANGKVMKEPPFIRSGSKLKVKYKLFPYSWNTAVGASVKIQLDSVMLVELATSGNGGDWGADEAEEGGYSQQSPEERQWSQDDGEGTSESGSGDEGDDGDF